MLFVIIQFSIHSLGQQFSTVCKMLLKQIQNGMLRIFLTAAGEWPMFIDFIYRSTVSLLSKQIGSSSWIAVFP